MKAMWQFILDNYHMYNLAGMYTALFLAALLFLFMKERSREWHPVFLYSSLFLMAVIFNPLTAKVMTKFMSGEEVYWRMFWLLPMLPVIAYGAVLLLEEQKEKKRKLILFAALFLMIVFSGNFAYTGNTIVYGSGGFFELGKNFEAIHNPYKVPDEVIEVCDIIEEADGGKRNHSPRAIVPWELVSYIRQYDANIEMLYGRLGGHLPRLREEMYGGSPDIEKVVAHARVYSCEYIIFNVTVNYTQNPLDYDLELVGSSKTYRVFRDKRFEDGSMVLEDLEELYQ